MYLNLSHYCFFSVESPAQAKALLEGRFKAQKEVKGTVLIAQEGVNFNLCGEENFLRAEVTSWLKSLGCPDLQFKECFSSSMVFKRLKIKVKKEIITMGVPTLKVAELRAPHMPASEFTRILKMNLEERSKDWEILDTRNDFEVDIGTFKGAQPARMQSFRDFVKVAENLPKEKKIVMFCTGGVRCEKASALLKEKGFSEVYQLEGGILGYLEEEGWEHYQGGCFVFDDRRQITEETFLTRDKLEEQNGYTRGRSS